MAGLLAPLNLLPVTGLALYNNRQHHSDHVPTSFLLGVWTISGFVAPAISAALQYTLGLPVGKLLFGDRFSVWLKELARHEKDLPLLDAETVALRRELAFSPQHWILNFYFSFFLAGVVEEGLKYAVLRIVQRFYPGNAKSKKSYITISMAAGLGFATIENLAFLYAASRAQTPAQQLLTVVERVVFGNNGHMLTAMLSACKFVTPNEDGRTGPRSFLAVIAESACFHGLLNFSLFSLSALYGNIGWVHPRDPVGIAAGVACAVGLQGLLAWRVRREMADLSSGPSSDRSSSDLSLRPSEDVGKKKKEL